jgi:hypothetical protein
MAARRHDAHTTRTPQAMVPAQVLPRVRCDECGFIFFGPPGNRCEICQAKDVPHEAPEAPETPTPLDSLHRYWRQVTPEERLRFLCEMLTPNERRALQFGFEEK